MTRAVVKETRAMLKTDFVKTIGIISELLIVCFEEHTVDVIEYKEATSSEFLASYAAYNFIHEQLLVGSKMGILLGLTETTAIKMYRTQHNSKTPEAFDRILCKAAKYLAETVATSLGNVMEQFTQ